MDYNLSLCVAYAFSKYDSRISLYRIADYSNGSFIPVDPTVFNDYEDAYSPKFIRTRPDENPSPYYAVMREWEAIPKNDDDGKFVTMSYPCDNVTFYEIIIDNSLQSHNDDEIATHLKKGIDFHESTQNLFLLVIDQDEASYHAVLCKQSNFKKIGNKTIFDGRIDDISHSTQSLNVYIIDKNDVFNTSKFNYLFTTDGEPARIRYFYAKNALPEIDRKLIVYSLSDYIPIFLNRYLKDKSKTIQLAKSTIRKTIDAIKEAFESEDDLRAFFSNTPYTLKEIQECLPKYESVIVDYLSSHTDLSLIIDDFLQKDDELRDHFISEAKQIWLDQSDKDRDLANQEIDRLHKVQLTLTQENDSVLSEMAEMKKEKEKNHNEINHLNNHKQALADEIAKTMSDFDSVLGKLDVYATILNKAGFSQNKHSESKSVGFSIFDGHVNTANAKVPDCIEKACRYTEHNLSNVGVIPDISQVLSRIIFMDSFPFHSLIIPEYNARDIANALSYSFDGEPAMRLNIMSSDPDYNMLYTEIANSPKKVVLIENLLDFYNETAFISLNKDIPEKLFIISINNDSSISMLSKNIWNYALYISPIFIRNDNKKHSDWIQALGKSFVSVYDDETYDMNITSDHLNLFKEFGIPAPARLKIIEIYNWINTIFSNVDRNQLLDSILAELCIAYGALIDPDLLDRAKETMGDAVKDYYGW